MKENSQLHIKNENVPVKRKIFWGKKPQFKSNHVSQLEDCYKQ